MKLRWLCALVAAVGCGDPAVDLGEDEGFDGRYTTVTDIDPSRSLDVDVLFVIDNSGSMAEEQAQLKNRIGDDFFTVFESIFGVRPNLHIGVVSSDLGAGPNGISGCEGNGDNGVLQNAPRDACPPPSGRFIIDTFPDGGGPRDINYEGSLADAFGCIAPLGINGCGFEQPLEAVRRALDGSNSENDGFLRDDALLAVVFLTDEDDCSVSDTAMFDTSQDSVDSPLGPLSSFRCFEFGVVCEDDEPRATGVRKNCISRLDSPYMPHVSEYIDFLHSLKDDPSKIIVASISGPSSPVAVTEDAMGNPVLEAACTAGAGRADPAVRMHTFLAGFPGRWVSRSICDVELTLPLQHSSAVIAGSATGSPCLLGALADADESTPGLQPDCGVFESTRPGTESDVRSQMRACADADGALPCYEITTDPVQCGHTETGLAVDVTEDPGGALETHVLVRCVVPGFS